MEETRIVEADDGTLIFRSPHKNRAPATMMYNGVEYKALIITHNGRRGIYKKAE